MDEMTLTLTQARGRLRNITQAARTVLEAAGPSLTRALKAALYELQVQVDRTPTSPAEETPNTERPALPPDVVLHAEEAAESLRRALSGRLSPAALARALREAERSAQAALLAHGGAYLTEEQVNALAERSTLGIADRHDFSRTALIMAGGDAEEAAYWLLTQGAR